MRSADDFSTCATFAVVFLSVVLFHALPFTGLLRLILRLKCVAFCAALKVLIGDLQGPMSRDQREYMIASRRPVNVPIDRRPLG